MVRAQFNGLSQRSITYIGPSFLNYGFEGRLHIYSSPFLSVNQYCQHRHSRNSRRRLASGVKNLASPVQHPLSNRNFISGSARTRATWLSVKHFRQARATIYRGVADWQAYFDIQRPTSHDYWLTNDQAANLDNGHSTLSSVPLGVREQSTTRLDTMYRF